MENNFRIDAIFEIDGVRKVENVWYSTFEAAFTVFTAFVKSEHCLECLVYSREKGEDILMYMP